MASNDNAATVRRHFAVARANGWLPIFAEASREYNIPVEILLAIASRETAMGTQGLRADGSNGRGMLGIMQLNRAYHPVRGTDHRAVIRRAAWYLSGELRRAFSPWNYRLAGYNAGPYGGVRRAYRAGRSPDPYTDGRNYPTDVLRRAAIMRAELVSTPGGLRGPDDIEADEGSPPTVLAATGAEGAAGGVVGVEDWDALADENATLERGGMVPPELLAAAGLAAVGVFLVATGGRGATKGSHRR